MKKGTLCKIFIRYSLIHAHTMQNALQTYILLHKFIQELTHSDINRHSNIRVHFECVTLVEYQIASLSNADISLDSITCIF